MALTRKQRAFIDAYVVNFNATQAAINAGYSQKTAGAIGHENLNKPEIKKEIDAIVQQRIMQRDQALAKLADIATFDISPYIVSYGRLTGIDVQKMVEDGYGHLIRGIKQTSAGTEIQWADPGDALKTILKETHPTGSAEDPEHVSIRIEYADADADTPPTA